MLQLFISILTKNELRLFKITVIWKIYGGLKAKIITNIIYA